MRIILSRTVDLPRSASEPCFYVSPCYRWEVVNTVPQKKQMGLNSAYMCGTYKKFARCCEKSSKIDEARRKYEMGIEVADTTIEGSHKWNVDMNTNLAMILYKNYPIEVGKA